MTTAALYPLTTKFPTTTIKLLYFTIAYNPIKLNINKSRNLDITRHRKVTVNHFSLYNSSPYCLSLLELSGASKCWWWHGGPKHKVWYSNSLGCKSVLRQGANMNSSGISLCCNCFWHSENFKLTIWLLSFSLTNYQSYLFILVEEYSITSHNNLIQYYESVYRHRLEACKSTMLKFKKVFKL